MKRFIATIMILVALLALTPGVAFAGSALELVEVRNDDGGPTFVFHVTGEFSRSDLENGFVRVEGGDTYPLYCQQVDETTVLCHTTLKVSGMNVVIGFGGSVFWHKVPDHRSSSESVYCYNVYDEPIEGQPDAWIFQGQNCQESQASQGDSIYFYSPYWDSSYTYYFEESGLEWYFGDPSTNPGTGYYYEEPCSCSGEPE